MGTLVFDSAVMLAAAVSVRVLGRRRAGIVVSVFALAVIEPLLGLVLGVILATPRRPIRILDDQAARWRIPAFP
jgi:hypothetical protein